MKIKYSRNLIFGLFALYYAQGSLYPTGSIISQITLLLIFIICLYYIFASFYSKLADNSFFKAWTSLLLLNTLGFILTADYSNPIHTEMFKNILICSLSFYPFYFFSRKQQLLRKHLVVFLLILIPITILRFYGQESRILLDRVTDNTNVVNNMAYLFVCLIPYAFLIKKPKVLSYSVMLVLMFFILQGSKRGAIVAGSIGLVLYLYYQLKSVSAKRRLSGYIISSVLITVLIFFGYQEYLNNEFLVQRMSTISEGNSSGRDIIYSNIWDGWLNSASLTNLIFGFGFAGSLSLTGGSLAHNDWLELLSNFGLLGFSTYLMLFLAAVRYIYNSGWDLDKRIVFISIIAIWFFMTLFSMWYTTLNVYTQSILLGYLLGDNKKSLN